MKRLPNTGVRLLCAPAVLLAAVVLTVASLTLGGPASPAAPASTLATSATASPSSPPVVKKYVRYDANRKRQTATYCQRRYHQRTYRLTAPKAIVLHHTAGATWQSAWQTFNSNTPYNGEAPGVSAHYIIHKDGTIYACLPLSLRARHAIGMNWSSIGIEFVQEPKEGKDGHWMDQQILNRPKQLRAGVRLVRYLKRRYGITNANVIGHAMANNSPWFRDYTGAKNAAGDWYTLEVKRFRKHL